MFAWKSSSVWRAGATGTGVGLVLVAVVYLIAKAAGENFEVTPVGRDAVEEATLVTALVLTFAGGVVGTLLAWLFGRFAPRPRMTFLVVCVVLFVLYSIAPFTASEAIATAIWLVLLHVAAALPIVGSLVPALADKRPTDQPAVA